jgi:hypothetical protein
LVASHIRALDLSGIGAEQEEMREFPNAGAAVEWLRSPGGTSSGTEDVGAASDRPVSHSATRTEADSMPRGSSPAAPEVRECMIQGECEVHGVRHVERQCRSCGGRVAIDADRNVRPLGPAIISPGVLHAVRTEIVFLLRTKAYDSATNETARAYFRAANLVAGLELSDSK